MSNEQTVTQVPVPAAVKQLPTSDITAGMMTQIQHLAADTTADVAKMEALINLYERVWNKNAEIAFNRDYAAMSLVMPRVEKTKTVQYKDKEDGKLKDAFKYAKFEDIDEAVRPIIQQFGFTLSFLSEPREGGGLTIHGILAHREGHSRKTSLPMPLDTSGGKTNQQGIVSTSSYGRRCATCILLNVITVDEDTDGNGDHITIDEAVRIDNLINGLADGKEYKIKFLDYMKAERVDMILQKDHAKATMALDLKIKDTLEKSAKKAMS